MFSRQLHRPWLTNAAQPAEHFADLSPQAQHAQSMKLIWRPLDLILVLLLLAAMAFTILRGLVWTQNKYLHTWLVGILSLYAAYVHAAVQACRHSNQLYLRLCFVDILLFCPPCVGGSGLPTRRLFHLPSALWALPEGPCWLPPCHGDRFVSLFVSMCQC